MQPGDLVQLCNSGPDYDQDDNLISIGEDNGTSGRTFPVGALCVYLGPNSKWSRNRSAVNILIDGITGWVWETEILSLDSATAVREIYDAIS